MPLGAFAPLPLRLGGSAEGGITSVQHARLAVDLAACRRTLPLARWSFTQDEDSPFSVTINSYGGQNGAGVAYAPDTITVNAFGDVSFQWSNASWTDDYGISAPIAVRHAMAKTNSYPPDAGWAMVEPIARGVRVRFVLIAPQDAIVAVRIW